MITTEKTIRILQKSGRKVSFGAGSGGMIVLIAAGGALAYLAWTAAARLAVDPLPELPATPGMEGAGVVEEIGEGVTEVAVGDRVAYCSAGFGAYAEALNLPATRLVRLPEGIDYETAAGCLLKDAVGGRREGPAGCPRTKAHAVSPQGDVGRNPAACQVCIHCARLP